MPNLPIQQALHIPGSFLAKHPYTLDPVVAPYDVPESSGPIFSLGTMWGLKVVVWQTQYL